MANIGVFYGLGFDPGAYVVALFHAQARLAGTSHRLSLHTFEPASLAAAAGAAPEVDALITFGAGPADLDVLRQGERPAVVCERVVDGCSYVAPDNYDMGRTAASYLLGLGHRALAVALPGRPETVGDYHGTRLKGFLETAARAGQRVDERDVLFGEKTEAGGEQIAATLLDRPALPEAIFMQNLSQLLGLTGALQRRGLRIPEDLSVVGTSFKILNGHEAADYVSPPLTAVTFSKEAMGSEAVRIVVDAVEGRSTGRQQVMLPGILIERRSATSRSLEAPHRVTLA
jgi:DNA-binding LacI/PurR family transcriptional regulator